MTSQLRYTRDLSFSSSPSEANDETREDDRYDLRGETSPERWTPQSCFPELPHYPQYQVDHQNSELNLLLQEALTEKTVNGCWIRDKIAKYSCPPSTVIRSRDNSLKFVNLSASNYEMAREVDMNLAEVDMETFRTQDLDSTFRLAYSSPVHQDLIRVCRDDDMRDCFLMNSSYDGMDRSKGESVFRDEMLFSSHENSQHKSILTNQTFSVDSLSISDSSRELVLKCNQADKTKYMIAFDSSRIGSAGADAFLENDFLPASLNHNNRRMLQDSSMTGSLNGNTDAVTTHDPGSSSSATFATISSPGSDFKFNATPPAGGLRIPIYESHVRNRTGQKDDRGQDHISNSSSFSSAQTPDTESGGSSPQGNLTFEPAVIPHRGLKQPTSHSSRKECLNLPVTCAHALERLKMGASPIREEEELSTDSSRADIQMISRADDGSSFTRKSRSARTNSHALGSAGNDSVSNGEANHPDSTLRSQRRENFNFRPKNWGLDFESQAPDTRRNSQFHHPIQYPDNADWSKRRPYAIQRIRSAPQTPCSNHTAAPTYSGYPSSFSCVGGSRCEPLAKPQETVYVCYPNYSLPDLSFLSANPDAATAAGSTRRSSGLADANVLLSPTKPQVRPVSRQVGANAAPSKTRPKSFSDMESLSKSTIALVKDWESLNFLLPEDVKAFLGAKGLSPVNESDPTSIFCGRKRVTPPGKLFSPSAGATRPIVKMRTRINARNDPAKRLSLQEPLTHQQQETGNCATGRKLTRSETMQTMHHCGPANYCVCTRASSALPCCQHHAAPVCCHTAPACFRALPAACCRQRSLEDNSIETLCQMLNMQHAVKDVSDLLNGLKPAKWLKTGDMENRCNKAKDQKAKSTEAGAQRAVQTASNVSKQSSKPLIKPHGKPVIPPKPKSLSNDSGQQLTKSPTTPFKSMIPVAKTPTKSLRKVV